MIRKFERDQQDERHSESITRIKGVIVIAAILAGFTAHAAGSTNVVVMLGDSTTLCSRNPSGAKLTDCVQAELDAKNLSTRIVNSGKGGDTARGGLGRLQADVLAHDPVLVTISFGLNDTGKCTPDEYRDWMEKIVQGIQSDSSARILLITSTPFDNRRHAWKEKFRSRGGLDEYMDAEICAGQREIARKYDLRLCDLHAHFISLFEKDPKLMDKLIMPDGVHLTDKGNEVAAQYVAPVIAEMLVHADDFYLIDATGKKHGPFDFKQGETLSIAGHEYTISKALTQEQKIMEKMKAIIIPEIEFREASIPDVIEFLRDVIVNSDPKPKDDHSRVSCILNLDPSSGKVVTTAGRFAPDPSFPAVPKGHKTSKEPRITLSARDISLFDAMNLICKICNLQWLVQNGVVVIEQQEELQGPVGDK